MGKDRPLILVSNDDGYHSKGIRSLVEMISDMGDVLVCAPEAGRSGFACAFSAAVPLRMKRRKDICGMETWSCTGTPVDCVKMALSQLCRDRWPDMIIGGINHGDNSSVNTHYSGTMGVTMEGCMKYIPSVAFSLCDHRDDADFEPLRHYVRAITRKVLNEGLPKGICLNVNFPLAKEFKGMKACRMARGTWDNEVDKREHPHGYDYYWMTGEYHCDEPEANDTDYWALRNGYVAVTPTTLDVTAYDMLGAVSQWRL